MASSPPPGPVAAIDCGTNSTRVLVLDPSGRALARDMRVTRLGAGVDASGRLAPEAIERTVACTRDYRRLLEQHGVTRVRVAATSAARDAANRDELFDAVEAALGTRPELLSGTEEGALAWAGATAGLARRRSADGEPATDVLVDIGGGSTEFVAGHPGSDPIGSISVNTGCVRITEQFLRRDPPSAEQLSQAVSVVHTHLDDVAREVPDVTSATRLIGVAGSITTVAAVELGLQVYDRERIHHFVLTRAAAEDVFRTVATEPAAQRAHNPGLHPDRVGTIVGGALILVTIMRHFGFDTCLVSESDILDGIAATLLSA